MDNTITEKAQFAFALGAKVVLVTSSAALERERARQAQDFDNETEEMVERLRLDRAELIRPTAAEAAPRFARVRMLRADLCARDDGDIERGEVIARAEYQHTENNYLIRYRAGDGRQVESWWGESAIRADEPAPQL